MESNLILFTTHCPKCEILERKLEGKRIDYEVCEDTEKMKDLGIRSLPMLEDVGSGGMMSFVEAVKYVNSL